MESLLALEDVRSRDPRVAGAKAAGLAQAMAAGLPVLPGWVVPADAASAALRAGADACGRRGHAAAVLATAGAPLEAGVVRNLREVVGAIGGSAIVRSSTEVDADPRWAGAFATYADVGPDDVGAAVRGCWASAFSRDALGRCDAMGVRPGGFGIAVLVQPWVAFDDRGTAVVHPDGVRVTGGIEHRRGSPAELAFQHAGPPEDRFRAVAELAHAALRATGGAAIEWGRSADRLVLLQVRTAPTGTSAGASGSARRPARSFPPIAERLASLAIAFGGPLGDRWVLPWALAGDALEAAPAIEVRDLPSGVVEARALAAGLAAQAWGAEVAVRESAVVIRSVLGPSPDAALGRLASLRPVDPAAAARLVGTVVGMGRALTRRGAIGRGESVWRLTPEELVRAANDEGVARPRRFGPDRWEPFVFSVVSGDGDTLGGDPASPGIGAGRLRILRGPDARWAPGPREILAVSDAAPQIAPLLWNAAGLVTARGNPGAHLFEVARSLGVPAVVGVDVPPGVDGALAAVDGDEGSVSILDRPASHSAETGA